MSEYAVPIEAGDGYMAVTFDDELEFVDVMCKLCRTVRMQRFCAPVRGGLIGIKLYRRAGKLIGSPYKVRDGVPYWHLACEGCEHQVPLSGDEVRALLHEARAGNIPARRAYL